MIGTFMDGEQMLWNPTSIGYATIQLSFCFENEHLLTILVYCDQTKALI